MSAPAAEDPGAPGSATSRFTVRFSPRFSLSPQPGNSLRLTGSGEIEFGRDASGARLRLRARRARPLRPAESLHLEYRVDDSFNVHREDKVVSFAVVSGGAPLALQLHARNPAEAAQIASRLSTRATIEFARLSADLGDFQRRLHEVGGPPWATRVLVAVNLAVFAVAAALGGGVIAPHAEWLARWGANYGPLTLGGEWWRLGSAMFLHFGLLHLAFNCWALYAGGTLIERLFGSARFTALYLVAGLAGSLASLNWNPAVNSAGASGAIFGLYGAMLAFFLARDTRVPAAVIAQQRNAALGFIAYSLAFGFVHAGIDNAAHLGGLVSGFALGWCWKQPLDREHRARRDPKPLLLGLIVGLAICGALSLRLLHPSPQQAQERQLRANLLWMDPLESRASRAFNDAVGRYRDGALDNDGFAAVLESEVVPPWRQIDERFGALALPAQSPLAPLASAYRDFAAHRRQAFELQALGLRTGNPALMQTGRALLDQSEREIERIRHLEAQAG